jgi:hypothetical protein
MAAMQTYIYSKQSERFMQVKKIIRSKKMKNVWNAFSTWMVKSGEASSKCYYNNKRAYYI